MALELSCLDMELLLSFSTPVDSKEVPAAVAVTAESVQSVQPTLEQSLTVKTKTNDSQSDVNNESRELSTSEISLSNSTLMKDEQSSLNNSIVEVIHSK